MDTRIVDLGGAFVVPGFIDNHMHFLFEGMALASVYLRDAATPETCGLCEIAETQSVDTAGRLGSRALGWGVTPLKPD